MAERKEAVVVGALGVIGRYIVERLLRQDDWSVIALWTPVVKALGLKID